MLPNPDEFTLPSVPQQVTSLDGQHIDTSGAIWRIRGAPEGGRLYPLNWSNLTALQIGGRSIFSSRAQHLIMLYLADGLTRLKASTVFGYFHVFSAFGRWLVTLNEKQWAHFEWSAYDESLARRFLDWCIRTYANQGENVGRLRTFIKWGVARQYPDFTLEQYRVLRDMPIVSGASRRHTSLRHVTRGVLSSAEKQLIIQALMAEKGRVHDRVIVMLHLELGLNPAAPARLLNQDFKCVETAQGTLYQLDVPRVKKGTAHRETKRRSISQRLGQLLVELQKGEPGDRLLHWLGDQDPQHSIMYRMEYWVKSINLISPRTYKLLNLTPRRFRYTLATHLAEEGASKQHIAEVLDHSNLKTVNVYVETTSRIIDPVATATDAALRPLVHLFLGKVVDNEADAPTSQMIGSTVTHLPLPVLSTGYVGVCGRDMRQDGLCQLFPPLSCYLCPSFIALRDGPHHELWTSLNTFITAHPAGIDKRILRQLSDIQEAISEVLRQIEPGEGDSGEVTNGQ